MKRQTSFIAAYVVSVVTATYCMNYTYPLQLQFFERERYGESSRFAIEGTAASQPQLSCSYNLAAGLDRYIVSARGSWETYIKDPFLLNPHYLYFTFPGNQSILSVGFGYQFTKNKSAYTSSEFECLGPYIGSFKCDIQGWHGRRVVNWERVQSFFLDLGGMHSFTSNTAIFSAVALKLAPRKGFRYEEEYFNNPDDFSVKYFDYSRGAWESGIS